MVDLTPAMVKTAKAIGEPEPEFYLVECARRDQAITVANHFNMERDALDSIMSMYPQYFPAKVGMINTGQHIILREGQSTKISMHTDTILFKNWIVIRNEDDSDIIDMYEKFGMEVNHGTSR